MQEIRFTKHLAHAKTPIQGSVHAAGFDLYAADVETDFAHEQLIVDTGLKVAFPADYALLIYGRSGLSMIYGIRLSNGVGVIDADYRGPLRIMLRSDLCSIDDMKRIIKVGARIAQAILTPVVSARWTAVAELDDTNRGDGGFGSTGTN